MLTAVCLHRFLRAGVQLEEYSGFEIDPKNNFLYRHIYILCPGESRCYKTK